VAKAIEANMLNGTKNFMHFITAPNGVKAAKIELL
jgi:hypothetical protein